MNRQPHRALVVEDEREAAADLVDVLKTCGCETVIATNRHDALLQLASTTFCIVLLDLEIGSEPDSIRGRVENGKAVLEEARRRFPERGSTGALPIIVISAHATDMEAALAAMRDGASDVVQKLWSAKEKADRIYAALERTGRTSHARCQTLLRNAEPANRPDGLVLTIPADREGQRAVVALSGRRAPLTMASLKILLRLVEARLSIGKVNKLDLGGRADRGFKAIAVLRDELRVAYAGDMKLLVVNDQKKHYWLAESVTIGEVNEERLRMFDDAKVSESARKIRNLLAQKEKFPGKA
jgi:CheY-like chemotaxis protein